MILDETLLLALAPEQLPNLRVARYEGGGMGIQVADLTPANAEGVRLLYSALSKLLAELREALRFPIPAEQVAAARVLLRRTAGDPQWRAAIDSARSLQQEGSTAAAQALHDVRGGALAALALTLELIAITDVSTADVVRTFYLTRDHLKIMRNALEDIDVPARERDMASRDHGTQLLFEKWASATHRQTPDRSARVIVDSTYVGPVSRKCLEFSALDRVLYNVMNNAVRFTSDGEVSLFLRPIENDLRFVVANAIEPAHQRLLEENHGDALDRLFLGGFTTGGQGVGLSICAEFVANAYGLPGASDASRDGYVGATLVGPAFVAWFHWPRAVPA